MFGFGKEFNLDGFTKIFPHVEFNTVEVQRKRATMTLRALVELRQSRFLKAD